MTFKNAAKSILVVSLFTLMGAWLSACGGSSGGGGSPDDVTIQGTLGTASGSRALAAGATGIGGVTVSALGDSSVTDSDGNFNITTDGNIFTGGPVAFSLSGGGVEGNVNFSNVAGGPGTTAYVDLTLEANGGISGISSDAAGNILSRVNSLGCTENQSFVDGGSGNLWKPISESTGTPAVLMPSEFQAAEFGLFNANGDSVAGVARQSCCDHNGGRDHRFLDRSAASLAGEPLPLTARYSFPGGRVVCLEVGNPNDRLD